MRLEQDGNIYGRKRADTIICFLNRDLNRIKKSNLDRKVKGRVYLMARREFIRRLDDVKRLTVDNKNSLKGYIIARTKELRKMLKSGIVGKTGGIAVVAGILLYSALK